MNCQHTDTVPVEVLIPGTFTNDVVAHVCKDCLEQLPANWGCTDCTWDTVETRRLCDPESNIHHTCTRRFSRHQEARP